MSAPRAVAIVIPACNEDALIERCVESVHTAIAELDARIAVNLMVVADACNDATASLARDAGAEVHVIDRSNVGAARASGIGRVVGAFAAHPERIWIANTDADSVVPRNWLTAQVALAAEGWDAVVGTVRPDFTDLSAAQVEAWRRSHPAGVANGHVHGANLGVRASSYLAVGGFTELTLHEDNDLVGRLVAHRARVMASSTIDVMTSGRQEGRAPGGYAQFLREELVP